MKIKLAFGFLPYISIIKELSGNKVGSSKYCFVWLSPKAEHHTHKHEEFHVFWWYLITSISTLVALLFADAWYLSLLFTIHVDPLLGTFIKPYKVSEESIAYAYGAKHHQRPHRYIEEIAQSDYHKKRYGHDFGERVFIMYKRFFI